MEDQDFAASLTLLVSDALAFTPSLTELQREVLVDALRVASRGGVTSAVEGRWCDRMLSVGCHITASYSASFARAAMPTLTSEVSS